MELLQISFEKLQRKHNFELKQMSKRQKLSKGDELRKLWDEEDDLIKLQLEEMQELLTK